MEYLCIPFVEFEIRFGTYSTKFDSNVDRNYFEKIKNVLSTGKWVNVTETKTTEYIKDNLRLNDSEIILKENVKTLDIPFKSSPFDIRLSINQEFKLNSYAKSFNKQDCTIRNKHRFSFIDQNFRYDLTIVNQTKNGINTTKHEIEFELLVNENIFTWDNSYLNSFVECKIYDIINIEPMDRETFKIDLNKLIN